MEQIRKEYSHEDKELIETFMEERRTLDQKFESSINELKEKSQFGKFLMINSLSLSLFLTEHDYRILSLHTAPVLNNMHM